MSDPTRPAGSSDPEPRLNRVEESLGYSERTIEQLSGEIADLNKRMLALTKRIGALEQRLGKLESPEDAASEE